MNKLSIGLLAVALAFNFLALPIIASAQTGVDFGITYMGRSGLGTQDPRTTIALVIRMIMGFLGTIAVVIVLIGGFKWMTAGGNEKQVEEGRKWITSGIIGLVIVLSAYGIATFVVNQLYSATTGG